MVDYLRKYFWFSLFVVLAFILMVEASSYFNNEEALNITNLNEVNENAEEVIDSKIWVDVKGEVVNPGVYEVNEDNIVNDVIAMAGGLKEGAYTNNINLSQKVEKQMVINIFNTDDFKKLKVENTLEVCYVNSFDISSCLTKGYSLIVSDKDKVTTSEETINGSTSNSNSSSKPSVVNINTASISILTTLPGIGEKKAQAIIDYRIQNGKFKSIEEITKVNGIGNATFEKIKSYLRV